MYSRYLLAGDQTQVRENGFGRLLSPFLCAMTTSLDRHDRSCVDSKINFNHAVGDLTNSNLTLTKCIVLRLDISDNKFALTVCAERTDQ